MAFSPQSKWTKNDDLYYLETLSIVGCHSLTNLTSLTLPLTYSLKKLKLSHGSLRHIEADALSNIGPWIQHLDFAHNFLNVLPPAEFFSHLVRLQSLDLSGNQFLSLDLSYLPVRLSSLKLDDCSSLASIDLTDQHSTLKALTSFSASNSASLAHLCPWILWGAPKLSQVKLSNNPKLDLPHRIFKANAKLEDVEIDNVVCDCSPPLDLLKHCLDPRVAHEGPKKKILVESFRQQNCHMAQPDQDQDDKVSII